MIVHDYDEGEGLGAVSREDILEVVFIEGNHEHDEYACGHSEDLQEESQPVRLLLLAAGDWMGVA